MIFLVKILELLSKFKTNIANSRKKSMIFKMAKIVIFLVKILELHSKFKTNMTNSRKKIHDFKMSNFSRQNSFTKILISEFWRNDDSNIPGSRYGSLWLVAGPPKNNQSGSSTCGTSYITSIWHVASAWIFGYSYIYLPLNSGIFIEN